MTFDLAPGETKELDIGVRTTEIAPLVIEKYKSKVKQSVRWKGQKVKADELLFHNICEVDGDATLTIPGSKNSVVIHLRNTGTTPLQVKKG